MLAELHARPFPALSVPHRVLRLAFAVGPGDVAASAAAFRAFAVEMGIDAPPEQFKHHRTRLGQTGLAFEAHTEFVTLTIDRSIEDDAPASVVFSDILKRLPALPRLLVAVDLLARTGLERPRPAHALAASAIDGGRAHVATDFRPDADGFVRIALDLQPGLDERRIGTLIQSVIEIEMYRSFALLGLPEAQKRAPLVGRIERDLTVLSKEMTQAKTLQANEALLNRLTDFAASLEADAAESAFRFRASQAYERLVEERLAAFGETPRDSVLPTLGTFLRRRFSPAMRTCESLVERQSELAVKLQRTADLLRTRVDVDMERQNGAVLEAMNERTRLQLRLQQTVEGLSIAAISYYIVGLFGYAIRGVIEAGQLPITQTMAMALSVPPIVAFVALFMRRVRQRGGGED
jgi:uncharacterized membrane-anchored protein